MSLRPHHLLDLQEWQRKLGGSFFAYDLDSMQNHLESLKSPGLRLWYACKANPLSAVLQTVDKAGLSFDVASLGELNQVLSQGVNPGRILLTGPGKSAAFLERAFGAGVKTFVAESRAQLVALEALAQKYKIRPRVLIRLQLSWEGEEGSVLGGSKTTVFGLESSAWGALDFPALHISGVHVFQWGNLQEASRLGAIWESIAVEARRFADEKKFPLEVLDLGGGLGIPYDQTGINLSWQELLPHLEKTRTRSGADELWMELGRYAVGAFGTYVTKVLERKTVRGENFLICEGGAQHMVRPALVGESFPVRCLDPREGDLRPTHVHGPLCTALDRLGTYNLPDVQAGDLLAFGQCGAYGFTESMPFFLCHDLPAEIVLQHNEWKVLREVAPAGSWLR
jgi:diaminopimelate decarboxylase